MKTRRREIWWFVILVGVVGVFFWQTLFYGRLPVPSDALVGLYHPWRDLYAESYPRGIPFKNFLITDPVRQQIPWRKIAIDQWKDANLPWWNPYTFSGTPLAANIQAGAFYPLNILFFLFSFPVAWTILIMLQPLLSGAFLFFYLRSHRLSPIASVFGALAWAFGGFSVAWLTWGTMVHVMAWLPLVLLAIDRVIEGKKRQKWTLVLSGAIAMSLFAGHSQIFLYVVLVTVGYGIWRLRNQAQKLRSVSRKWLVIALLGAVLMTAIQWVPLLSFLPETSRLADGQTWQKAGWFIPWKHLVQFVAPDFFGNPTTLNYWGEWNYGEFIGYIGVIPLLFAVAAMRIKARMPRFWLWVLGISLLFALPTPVAKLPYILKIPVLSSLQPTRLLSIASFSVAIFASFGLDAWLKGKKRVWWPVIFLALFFSGLWCIVLFGSHIGISVLPENLEVAKRNLILPTALFVGGTTVYLLGSLKKFRYICVVVLLVLSVFDLLRFGWKFTPFTDVKYFFPTTNVIEFLQHQPKPFRVMSLDDRLFPPNASAYYGLESIEGYDPIYSRSYEEFIASSERGRPDTTPPYGFNRIITPQNIDSPLIPLLNVRYVLSLVDIERPYLRKVFEEGETRVYEDVRAVGRAYFVEKVIYEHDSQKILEHLFDKDLTPMELAFVQKPLSLLSVPLMLSEHVVIDEYNSNTIRLGVQAENTRFLLISNIYDSNWNAYIDGKATDIIRANYIFQGLVVQEGKHEIVLRYRG